MSDTPASAPPAPKRGRADLTKGPIGKTLFLFSLPVLGSNVVQALSGSINAVWIGRLLGEKALTATSNANLVLFLLLAVVIGVGMAATIMVGQSVGRRDPDKARRVVGTCATFFAGISLVLAVAGYLLTPAILGLMGTPAEAQPLAIDYLRIVFVALPFIYILTFVGMVLRGSGDSRTPFLFMILSAVLDAGLNPLFILGVGPLPRLGIAGSATAMLIAQIVTLTAQLAWIYAKKYELRLHGRSLAYLRPDPALLRATVAKGVPMGLQMFVISGSAIAMFSLVNRYGVETSAAYGVAAQLWSYISMPAMAVGAACSSMAAQNVGAKLWDRVDATARAGALQNVLMTGALVAIFYVLERPALGLFLPPGSPAIDIAVRLNQIVSWSFVLFGITIVLFGVIRATGAVIPSLVILFVSQLLVRLPFAEALMPYWGADAIWWSFPLGSVVSVAMTVAYYKYGGWRQARMGPASPAPDASAVPAQP